LDDINYNDERFYIKDFNAYCTKAFFCWEFLFERNYYVLKSFSAFKLEIKELLFRELKTVLVLQR